MRCLSCNVTLTDQESTRKYKNTGWSNEFLDLCNSCYEPIKDEVPTVEGKLFKKGQHEQTKGISSEESQ